MGRLTHNGRSAVLAENEALRVVATTEGGHIAEITHKATGVNPLWVPPWPSIEPSKYNRVIHPEYGTTDESPVLAGLLGHSICLDTYGGPSREEYAAGIPIHGEGPMAAYQFREEGNGVSLQADLPLSQIRFARTIAPAKNGIVVRIAESVENLSASDRPIAWTQHVTLGPPFLARGETQFRASVTRSQVIDQDMGGGQKRAAEFEWPACPAEGGAAHMGGTIDLRVYPDKAESGGFTTHLVDPQRRHGYFIAWSPSTKVVFGYVWKRADFPWLCRWEENHMRKFAPWNGRTMACAMEFGVSPTVESRRDMVTRGSLWGVPAYRWLAAKERLEASYCAFITAAAAIPEAVSWDENESVEFAF